MKKFIILMVIYIWGTNTLFSQQTNFIEKELSINVDEVIISGTLTIPNSDYPVPAVILISGASADNRDAESYGFKPFKELANHLASNGIASFRYDDRGIGKSTGKLTYHYEIKDLGNDVTAAIEILKEEPKINSQQIGLIGHSAGGVIAQMLASSNEEIAFIISLAGTIIEPKNVNVNYRQLSLTQLGLPLEEVEKAVELEKRIVETTISGIGYDKLINDIKLQSKMEYDKLSENLKKRFSNWEDYHNQSWYGFWEPYINSPFYRSFFVHDPSMDLEKVKCPALFLFGSVDDLVRVLDAGPVLIESMNKAGNNNYTIRIIPNADHHLVSSWAQSDIKYAPGTLKIITDWITDQTKKVE
jgi:uncharacterized protein